MKRPGDSLEAKTARYIKAHRLIAPGERITVGLSGGADSVALLRVLVGLGYDCRAAHCNFHLRGAESDRDEAFCREVCRELGVELRVRGFDASGADRRRGESIEMACRRLRYDWWEGLMDEDAKMILAVGHHAEDNVETFLLNALRGCSVAGLKGMMPRRGRIVRPLLECTRAEIEAYLSASGLTYITDSTNADRAYRRNRLRLDVVPALEGAVPDAIGRLTHTIACLRDDYALLADHAEHLRELYVAPDGSIDLTRLPEDAGKARGVLYTLLGGEGLNATQCGDIVASFEAGESGKSFHGHGTSYSLDRGVLSRVSAQTLTEREADLGEYPFGLRIISMEEFHTILDGGNIPKTRLYLDASALTERFTLRPWREGDRIRPLGMRGSKLVSDIFADAKLSAAMKHEAPLLVRGDEVIWAVGLRASRTLAVTPATERVAEITYNAPLPWN